jgi:hypothetical protein
VWPTLILLALIMLSTIGLVLAAFFTPGGVEVSKILGEAHGLSRLVVLILVIPMLGALTILKLIDGSVAAASLSAITGYVLGSTTGQ